LTSRQRRRSRRDFLLRHVALVAGRLRSVPGSVYRVRPEGPVEHDPDYEPGVSYTAASAVILEVVESRVVLAVSNMVRLGGPYMTWADGGPVYDADGCLMPSPEARAAGMTREELRHLPQIGPGRPVSGLNKRARRDQLDRARHRRREDLGGIAADGGHTRQVHLGSRIDSAQGCLPGLAETAGTPGKSSQQIWA
jgi:hypothetical protein